MGDSPAIVHVHAAQPDRFDAGRIAVVGALVLVAVGAGLAIGALVWRRSERAPLALAPADAQAQNPQLPPALHGVAATASYSGLVLDEHGLRIADWGRWMAFAPKTLRDAKALGIRHPPEVLTYMMRQALPDYRWPPLGDSALSADWRAMLWVIESELSLPQPTSGGNPSLHVVR